MDTSDPEYAYDVFISYSHADRDWVQGWLLPKLEEAGLNVCIDSDFQIGRASVINMEKAVETSRHTVLVLTPNWVESQWTSFEALLVQTDDPTGLQGRLLPLMRQVCTPPKRISILTYADFTRKRQWDSELERLIAAIRDEKELPRRKPPKPSPWPKIGGGIAILTVGAALLVWFFLLRSEPVEHTVCLAPGLSLTLPEIDTVPATTYSLRFIHNADTLRTEDIRNRLLFAGAGSEDLENFLQRSHEDTLYAGYDTYLTTVIPEPEARTERLKNTRRTRAILPTNRLKAGDAITVEIVRDSTAWQPSEVIATSTAIITAGRRVTTLIIEKSHGTN